jgi:hypothetical protein
MFAIEWLRRGITVEREISGLANPADVIAAARGRADVVAARNPHQVPDSFRVTDNATGAVLITFKFLYEHR